MAARGHDERGELLQQALAQTRLGLARGAQQVRRDHVEERHAAQLELLEDETGGLHDCLHDAARAMRRAAA